MDEKLNKDPSTWAEVYQKNLERQMGSTSQLASEMLADSDKKDARKNRVISYLIGVIIVLVLGLIGSNIYWVYQWNSYDYVSQDGDGYNYYNSDVEGDVQNGAADQAEGE